MRPLSERLRLNREQRERYARGLVAERLSLQALLQEGDAIGEPPKILRELAGLTRSQVQRVRQGRLPRPWEVENE